MRWWRGLSLRSRLILIGTAGLAAGLALGGLLMVLTLRYTLQRSLDESAVRTAREVATLIDTGRLPDPIPVAPGAEVVQVVDENGGIRQASAGADRLVAVLRPAELRRARAGDRLYVSGDRASVDGPLRVVAVPAGTPDDPQTVLVAVPAQDLTDAVRVLRNILLVAYPLLVLVLVGVAWRVVGATLRPVEALRRGAEEITGPGQLPVPSARDEIYRLAVTLNGMLDRLEAARQRQRAFVADAAHELRSPLTSMRTQLEVSSRIHEPAPVDDLLLDVARLSRLVDDLLLLARADDAGLPAGRREPVDVTALLTEVAGRYPNGRVPVTVSAASYRPLWTEGDPDRLGRIVTNLVDNAVRYASSSVVLAAAPESGRVLLTVTDDGPGIAPADRERVFDRFTRLDDARGRDEGGSGLGLAIARELARLHGGTVRLADAAPGVRAEIRLPTVEAP